MVGDLFLWGFCCLKLWKRDKKVRYGVPPSCLGVLSAQSSRVLRRFTHDINYYCETHGDSGDIKQTHSLSLGTFFRMLCLGIGFEYSWDATILDLSINKRVVCMIYESMLWLWVGLRFCKRPTCWWSRPEFVLVWHNFFMRQFQSYPVQLQRSSHSLCIYMASLEVSYSVILYYSFARRIAAFLWFAA